MSNHTEAQGNSDRAEDKKGSFEAFESIVSHCDILDFSVALYLSVNLVFSLRLCVPNLLAFRLIGT